jgi:hypothetical protein
VEERRSVAEAIRPPPVEERLDCICDEAYMLFIASQQSCPAWLHCLPSS